MLDYCLPGEGLHCPGRLLPLFCPPCGTEPAAVARAGPAATPEHPDALSAPF